MIVKTVLLSGKQGSGKTTIAGGIILEFTKKKNWYAHNIFFAEPLYDMHNFCWGLLKDNGIKMPFKKDGYLLQMLGTEWGRNTVSENLWVDLLKKRREKIIERSYAGTERKLFVVSDCRFPNEVTLDAIKVRLECPAPVRKARAEMWRETEDHPSETALDNYTGWDMVLDTEKVDANECVRLVMEEILK